MARKRLLLEQFESRDLFAIAEFTTQLYADDGGVPGEVLAANEIGVGESFFVEILAREYHPRASGLRAIALDLKWNPDELEVLDENVADTVTDDLPAFHGGTLDAAAGTITDLTGSAMLSQNAGRPIGNLRAERFALLHFVGLAPVDGATISMKQGGLGITTSPVMSLGKKDLNFVAPEITIVGVDTTTTDADDSGSTEIDDNTWTLDIPVDEHAVDDVDGEPSPGDVIFFTLGSPAGDDPQVDVWESLEAEAEDVPVSDDEGAAPENAAPDIDVPSGDVPAGDVEAENLQILSMAAGMTKIRDLAASPLTKYRAAHEKTVHEKAARAVRKVREVVDAAPPVKIHNKPTVQDWSTIQVMVVGEISMEELSLADSPLTKLSAAPTQAEPLTDVAPDTAASAAMVAGGGTSADYDAESAAPTEAQRPTVAEATATSSSFIDSIASRWKHISKKIFSFDWSPFVVLLAVLCCASSSFAQEQDYYNPLEVFNNTRRVRRPPAVSRPLPPIRRSVATVTDEDILAVAAEEEIVPERPPLERRAAIDPRSTRRAHYQQEIRGPNIELPAEMQSGEYIYQDGGDYLPQSQGGGFFGGMFGSRGAGMNSGTNNRGQKCQNCGPLWIRGEYLLWWMEGFDVPPLVTSAPNGTNRNVAGILGQNATSILYGGETLENGSRSGGRFTAGWWLDPYDTIGLQATYFILDGSSSNFAASSPGTGIIARPFFNVEPGFEGQDAELVAYPGLFLGSVNVESTTSLQGLDFLLRGNIATQGCWRVDGLAGYRYQRLKDGLTISDNRTVIGTNTGLAVGTTFSEFDQFNTANEFHGGEVGMVAMYRGKRGLTLEGILKLAVGNNHQTVLINGQSSTSVPVAGAVPQVVNTNAGLLAQSTNIGTYKTDQFAVIPELGANIGYYFTPCLRGTVGYTFMYWTDVVRPGGQIDPNLNLSQLAVGGLNGIPRPEYRGVTDNMWVHGVSVGLDWQF